MPDGGIFHMRHDAFSRPYMSSLMTPKSRFPLCRLQCGCNFRTACPGPCFIRLIRDGKRQHPTASRSLTPHLRLRQEIQQLLLLNDRDDL